MNDMELLESRKKIADKLWKDYDPYENGDIPEESEITSSKEWKIKDKDVWLREYDYTNPIADDNVPELLNIYSITFADNDTTVLLKEINAY